MPDSTSTGMASTTCQFCGASFNRGADLTLHYQEMHSGKIGEAQEGKDRA